MTNLKAIIVDEERLARVNLKENAARTFEMNALDFLSKPVNPELLKEAIGKVKRT